MLVPSHGLASVLCESVCAPAWPTSVFKIGQELLFYSVFDF